MISAELLNSGPREWARTPGVSPSHAVIVGQSRIAKEEQSRAAYSGRQILPLAATSSRGGVISDLHNPLAPRDGYTKFGNQVGSNPP